MKKTSLILTTSAILMSAFTAQAHVTEDATHVHDGSQMRSTIQAMSPADRLNFRNAMHQNLEGLSTEEKQAFRNRMKSEHGLGQGNQHKYGSEDGNSRQGNKHMHGSGSQGSGNGYGRGYGRR